MTAHLTRYRLSSIAPWTTLAACAGLAIGDGVLSAITPDHNMVGDTSSQLMSPDARYSVLARVIVGLYAVLLIPLAAGLSDRFSGAVSGRPILAALVVTAIWVHIAAALVSALALNDSEAEVIGGLSANEIHDQAALVMFGAAFAVLVGYAAGHRSSGKAMRLATFVALGIFVIPGPLFVAEVWTEVNGVSERILGALFMTWMSVVAWSWRAGPGDPPGPAATRL